MTLPDGFPGAWQDWPIEVKRFVTLLLLEKALELHDGPDGLVKFLYAGHRREGTRFAFTSAGAAYWPWLRDDVQRWVDAGQPVPLPSSFLSLSK